MKCIHNAIFENTDYAKETLELAEYEACTFRNCNFSEYNLAGFKFSECLFAGCNLSLVKLNGTLLMNIAFIDCKMLGLWFDTCDAFGLSFSFENCQLNHSSFFKIKIKKTDFRTAYNYSINPEKNKLKKSRFASAGIHGLLDKYDLVIEK